MEQLEDRRLLAGVIIAFDDVQGFLHFEGTDQLDTVIVSDVGDDRLHVESWSGLFSYAEKYFTASQVQFLSFSGGGGDDQFQNNTAIPSTALGGDGSDILSGGEGDDVLVGGPGDDRLLGNGGADMLFGEDGQDLLLGGEGQDLLEGGLGDDQLFGEGGNDMLRGGAGADVVAGMDGDDQLSGGEGDDRLLGGAGEDVILGDGGNDEIHGESGNDSLRGGPDDDMIFGGDGLDTILGDDGADVLLGDGDDDTLLGGEGNDLLLGGDGEDILLGEGGDDQIAGDLGDDVLRGGLGNDVLVGGDGNDELFGEEGADTLLGESGDDLLAGGDDDDKLFGGDQDDSLNGGEGADQLVGGSGADRLLGGAGDDELLGEEGRDTLFGGLGADILVGGPDDDILAGGEGNDALDGGDGDDRLDGGSEEDYLLGGVGDDILSGGPGGDVLEGNSGNDFLLGSAGVDALSGGDGDDRLVGDEFDLVLDPGAGTADIVTTTPDSKLGLLANPANWPISTDEDAKKAILDAIAFGHVTMFVGFGDTGGVAERLELVDALREVGVKSLVQLQIHSIGVPAPPDGLPLTFADPEVRSRYLDLVRDFAERHPYQMNIAAEINLMAFLSPDEFDNFTSLYQEAYQLVKQISPETQVGYSLQYSVFLKLYQVDVVEAMGPSDYLGLTSYPISLFDDGLITSIDELGPDYYGWIRSEFPDVPIVFTEWGFPSVGGGDVHSQEDFISSLPYLMSVAQPNEIYLIQMHDVGLFQMELLPETAIEFLNQYQVDIPLLLQRLNNLGLHDINGVPRPAWFSALAMDLDSF